MSPDDALGDGPRGLRVLTLNVLSFDHADGERRGRVLADGIQVLRPDLVALQEVRWGDGMDDVTDILGRGYHVVPHSQRSDDGVGAALASRWPIGRTAELDLHVTARTSGFPWCAAVVAEVTAPPPVGPLLFVHHKPSWQYGYEHERELQAVAAARFVEEHLAERDLHVVLAGDFDATPDAASVRFWTGRQSLGGTSVRYDDAWDVAHPGERGHTFSPHNPLVRAGEMGLERGRRIDYVMVRCGIHGPTLDVAGCHLAFAEPVEGVWASDHVGLLADLARPATCVGSWDPAVP